MTRNFKPCVVSTSFVLLLLAQSAFGSQIVTVSSLSGLRDAIASAPAAGRFITLQEGVYHQSSPINIRNKDNITISGGTSGFDGTVIRGPGINDNSLGINFRISNSDDLTLKNLTIKDSFFHAVQINNNSDRFTANRLKTLDNGESGFKITSPANASGPSSYSDDGKILNSFIGFTEAGQRSVVEGVDIIGAAGWAVRGNIFENIRKPNGRAAYAAFAKGNSQDIVFANNVIRDSFIGISFGGGGTAPRYFRNGDTTYETRGGIIRDNLIYNVADAGIYLNKARDFEVYDNTIINSGERTGAIESRYEESSGIIRDNVLSGPIKLRDGGTAMIFDNTFVPENTPIPDPENTPIPDHDAGAISVDEPSGSAMAFLFAMSLAGIGFAGLGKGRFQA